MIVSVPVYVGTHRPDSGKILHLRPAFHDWPEVKHADLEQGLADLSKRLREILKPLSQADDHRTLAEWLFHPEFRAERGTVTIDTRKQTRKQRLLFLLFERHGLQVAMSPELPGVWFEVPNRDFLTERASDALSRFFLAKQREGDDEADPDTPEGPKLAEWHPASSGTVVALDLDLSFARPKPATRAMMGGFGELGGGRAELERVGTRLDTPGRARVGETLFRDNEVLELSRRLFAGDGTPALLLGPRAVGKSAIVREAAARRRDARSALGKKSEEFWHVAPARLISGMSYVGQWEERLLSILRCVRKKNIVLVLDDLVGLFRAGISAGSDLNVGVLLKPWLERREIRVVAESTPEQFRRLQEIDRGFADLFHRLPVAEPDAATARRTLYGVCRRLEARHHCRFALDLLPTVIEFSGLFDPSAAQPGRAAALLERLAAKFAHTGPGEPEPLGRFGAMLEFHAHFGVSFSWGDLERPLPEGSYRDALASGVFGQREATDALADLLSLARARLNDPGRPALSALLMGPTGVGKTECARAVARLLFSDESRMIRIDLNEYGDPGSAARLVGTAARPEGLLTAAIRRTPLAVVLLDEVEKADPEVFDLLLQVLGEGRLTDANGRTADFTRAVVLMTSNLGVREAEASFGFGDESGADARRAAAYTRAAERYFRPEFFNRIDRILPFRRLERGHVGRIAERLVNEVFQREGLRQRKATLVVSEAARERLVDAGFDPLLGARALKRAVERFLTRPIAERVAGLSREAVTLIEVDAGGEPSADDLGLAVMARTLEEETPRARVAEPADAPGWRALVRERLAATDAAMSARSTRDADFYAIQEQVEEIRSALRDLDEDLAVSEEATRIQGDLRIAAKVQSFKSRRRESWSGGVNTSLLQSIAAAESAADAIRYLVTASTAPAFGEWRALRNKLNLIDRMLEGGGSDVLLWFRARGNAGLAQFRRLDVSSTLAGMCRAQLALLAEVVTVAADGTRPAEGSVVLRGGHAEAIARVLAGTWLVVPPAASMLLVQCVALPLAPGESPQAAVDRALAEGVPLAPVTRVLNASGECVDCRTGLTAAAPDADHLREGVLEAL